MSVLIKCLTLFRVVSWPVLVKFCSPRRLMNQRHGGMSQVRAQIQERAKVPLQMRLAASLHIFTIVMVGHLHHNYVKSQHCLVL